MSTFAAADRPVLRSKEEDVNSPETDHLRDLEEEVRVRFGNRKRSRAELERERKLEAVSKKKIIKPSKNKSLIETFFDIGWFRAKIDKEKENARDKAADSCDSQLKALRRAHYENSSSIQMPDIDNANIPQTDFIGISEPGSGKTAAFVLRMLPCIARLPPITDASEAGGPYALVLAPTRHRALQIEEEALRFAYHLGIKVVSVVDRPSIEERGVEIRRGCDFVIATPPLLRDCLKGSNYCYFNRCKYVVLDEADRMMDMGFMSRGVDDVLVALRWNIEEDREVDDGKRIYMFTATMPPALTMLARTFLRNPVVGSLNHY